jgi:hypothetical protein
MSTPLARVAPLDRPRMSTTLGPLNSTFLLRHRVRKNCTGAPVVRSDIPREHAARAGCKRSQTEPLRCSRGKSQNGQVAGGGAQLRGTGDLP